MPLIKINMLSWSSAVKLYLPLFYILMTSKTKIPYKHVFTKIKQLISDNELDTEFNDKIITTYYEKSLLSAI